MVIDGNLNGHVDAIVGVNKLIVALVLENEMWMVRCCCCHFVQQKIEMIVASTWLKCRGIS